MQRPMQAVERVPKDPELPWDGNVFVVPVLAVVSYVLLTLGSAGLVSVVLLWAIALFATPGPLARALRPEADGVLFLFMTATYIDSLDLILGLSQRFTLATVALGALYLMRRYSDALAVLRTPVALFFAVFVAQEIASALAWNETNALTIAENRFTMLETVLCTAILVRRPSGTKLVPATILLATLMSVPNLNCARIEDCPCVELDCK